MIRNKDNSENSVHPFFLLSQSTELCGQKKFCKNQLQTYSKKEKARA